MKKYISEFIGTFCLVFLGTGAVMVNSVFNNILTHIGIALVFGIVIMVMIDSLGDISGAHFNPAVTIGFCISRNFPVKEAVFYILSQLLGAISGSSLLFIFFIKNSAANMGTTIPSGSIFTALGLEILFTFILMFVILRVSDGYKEKGIIAGLTIGGTICLLALVGGPLTGASMNPARSIAPSIFAISSMKYIWIYISGPIIGAVLAALFDKIINQKKVQTEN